jgi:hypothetical protein
MASEAQKGILASRARLRRPDEPTEPMARRCDCWANPLRPLRKPHFSSELRILVNERAARRGLGARQNRHTDSIAGCDRQEMGEDCGLFAVGQIGNDEAIASERLKVEDVGAGLYVRDERSGVCVEVGAADNKSERAQLANHVAATGAGLEDRAFDLDRTAERWNDPICVEGAVSVALETLKAARRDVAKIAGAAACAQGYVASSSFFGFSFAAPQGLISVICDSACRPTPWP